MSRAATDRGPGEFTLRFAEDVDEANEARAVDALSLWVAHKVCHLNSLSHFCWGLSPIHQTYPKFISAYSSGEKAFVIFPGLHLQGCECRVA